MLSWHVSRFRANSSRLPRAGICHEFQPQTFPRQPQRKHPRPGAPPGPPCGCWLPSRRLGGRRAGRGLPALFAFPLPALDPQTPVSPWRRPYPGKGTKTLQWGWGESHAGAMCSLHARTPQQRAADSASSPQHGSRLPLVPVLLALPPDPPRWVGLGERAEPRTGGCVLRAVRDRLACFPPAVSPQQPPGSPAQPARLAAPVSPALLLSINQPRVWPQQEWVQRDSLGWEGHSWLGLGRDRGRNDWTR